MTLKDLELRNQYRSDLHDLLEDFYIPYLEESLTYGRSVGFFSSTSSYRQGNHCINSGWGNMQLVTSPHLSEEDAATIAQNLLSLSQLLGNTISQEIKAMAFPEAVAGPRSASAEE